MAFYGKNEKYVFFWDQTLANRNTKRINQNQNQKKQNQKNKENGLTRGHQNQHQKKQNQPKKMDSSRSVLVLGVFDESIFFVFFGFGFGVDNLKMKCIVRGCFPVKYFFSRQLAILWRGVLGGGDHIYIYIFFSTIYLFLNII